MRLSDEVLSNILNLQQQLLLLIDRAKATEYLILEQLGETELTLEALDELQNVTEKLKSPFSRFYSLLLRIAEAQPIANTDTLELLTRTIQQAEATIASAKVSIEEAVQDLGIN